MQKSSLEGKIVSVKLNERELVRKYLTPPEGCSSSSPVNMTNTISGIAVHLDPKVFLSRGATDRPCIIVDVQPRSSIPISLNDPPNITILLISGNLSTAMAEEEFKRMVPIHPTTGNDFSIKTIPDWTSENRNIPSFVLCIPIKVYLQDLSLFDELLQVANDDDLDMLKRHVVSLGDISVNADYVELDEQYDDDDEDDGDYGEVMNRVVSWEKVIL